MNSELRFYKLAKKSKSNHTNPEAPPVTGMLCLYHKIYS